MSLFRFPPAFRSIVLLDAATCAGMGALLIAASEPLAVLTALPPALLFYAGLALLPVAVFMVLAVLRPVPLLAWLVIAGNLLWVLESFALLLSGWVAPNALGAALIAGQALAVAALSLLEYAALRGLRPAIGRAS